MVGERGNHLVGETVGDLVYEPEQCTRRTAFFGVFCLTGLTFTGVVVVVLAYRPVFDFGIPGHHFPEFVDTNFHELRSREA